MRFKKVQQRESASNPLNSTTQLHVVCIFEVKLTPLLFQFLENISYILQPNPVVVIIDPLSQFSSVGENAVLYCHINLTSDSQIKVDWRYNDKVLNISDGSNVNSNHTSIFDHTRNLYTSKLYIQNVSVNDEGYYECLVSDGLYTSEKSGSAMVTVSDRALLRIIGESIICS